MSNIQVKSTEEKAEMSSFEFPVFLVRSHKSLSQIESFIKPFGQTVYKRIMYDHEGKDTNRTIVVMEESIFKKMCDEGFEFKFDPPKAVGDGSVIDASGARKEQRKVDFTISRFNLLKSNFPDPEKHTSNLFVPVPDALRGYEPWVREEIVHRLKYFAEYCGILPKDTWEVHIPTVDRETGKIRTGCFIKFAEEVQLASVAMVRILLTDTYWSVNEDEDLKDVQQPFIFKCYWALRKDRQDRSERPGRQDRTETHRRGDSKLPMAILREKPDKEQRGRGVDYAAAKKPAQPRLPKKRDVSSSSRYVKKEKATTAPTVAPQPAMLEEN
jgi:hypothetical protein